MYPDQIGIPTWVGPVALGVLLALWPALVRALVHLAFDALTVTLRALFNALEWLFVPSSRRPRS